MMDPETAAKIEVLEKANAALRADLAKVRADATWAKSMLEQLQGPEVDVKVPLITLTLKQAQEVEARGELVFLVMQDGEEVLAAFTARTTGG